MEFFFPPYPVWHGISHLTECAPSHSQPRYERVEHVNLKQALQAKRSHGAGTTRPESKQKRRPFHTETRPIQHIRHGAESTDV